MATQIVIENWIREWEAERIKEFSNRWIKPFNKIIVDYIDYWEINNNFTLKNNILKDKEELKKVKNIYFNHDINVDDGEKYHLRFKILNYVNNWNSLFFGFDKVQNIQIKEEMIEKYFINMNGWIASFCVTSFSSFTYIINGLDTHRILEERLKKGDLIDLYFDFDLKKQNRENDFKVMITRDEKIIAEYNSIFQAFLHLHKIRFGITSFNKSNEIELLKYTRL